MDYIWIKNFYHNHYLNIFVRLSESEHKNEVPHDASELFRGFELADLP